VIVQGVFGKVGLSVGNVVLEDVEIVQENRSMGRELLSGPECTWKKKISHAPGAEMQAVGTRHSRGGVEQKRPTPGAEWAAQQGRVSKGGGRIQNRPLQGRSEEGYDLPARDVIVFLIGELFCEDGRYRGFRGMKTWT
jgi:hypothetical protein